VRQQDHVDGQAGLERAFGVDVFLRDEAGVLTLLLDVLVVPAGGLRPGLDNTSILERDSTCNLVPGLT